MKIAHKYIFAAILLTLTCQPLLAQSQTPAPVAPAPSSGPVMLLPDAALVGSDSLPTDVPQQKQSNVITVIETSSGGVSIEPLQKIDPEILGTLNSSTGDLGFEMWFGTSRPQIHTLIAQLPAQINSTALRDLTRRLLLTTADMKPLPADTQIVPSISKLRVKQLMNMGLLDDAVSFITLASKTGVGGPLRRELIEAHLFLNNYSEVCTQVALADDRLGESYWQKLLVFCQALAGDTSGAEFGTTLLADMGEDDPTFFTLIEKLTRNSKAKLSELPNPTALHMALAQLTETALPESILDTKNPSVLRAVSANSATSMDIRLKAAEQAVLMGAIGSKTLTDLYQSIEFSPDELANPISAASVENTPRNRALLYQAAANEPIPEGRALIIQKAITLAKQIDLYGLAIKVHLENIMQIQASPDLWWFAGDAARALYALERPLPAQAWLGHLRTQALRDPSAQAQLVDFWPLAGISAKSLLPEIDDEVRAAWANNQLANSPEEREALKRITLGYVLLDVLDQKIPASAWTELASRAETTYARMPNPAVGHMMLDAALAGKTGEAIAWAIIMLGELGPSHADPETTAKVIVSLRAIGFQNEARAIALEAAIANGL